MRGLQEGGHKDCEAGEKRGRGGGRKEDERKERRRIGTKPAKVRQDEASLGPGVSSDGGV